MKKYVKVIVTLLCLSTFFTACSTNKVEDESTNSDTLNDIETISEETESPTEVIQQTSNDYSIGSIVTLGNYQGEDITWIVLDEQDGKYLLLSENVLDDVQYNDEFSEVTWETCTLRFWLNNEFYNAAFSSDDQSIIVLSTVVADSHPNFDTDAGNDTEDNVFILSYNEVESYFPVEADRVCYATEYAISNGSAYDVDAGDYASWALRTPCEYQVQIAYINGNHMRPGCITDAGPVQWEYGIRPAIWVNP